MTVAMQAFFGLILENVHLTTKFSYDHYFLYATLVIYLAIIGAVRRQLQWRDIFRGVWSLINIKVLISERKL